MKTFTEGMWLLTTKVIKLLIKEVSISQNGISSRIWVGSTALWLLYSHALQKHLPWVTFRSGLLPEQPSVQTIIVIFTSTLFTQSPALLLSLMILEVLSNTSHSTTVTSKCFAAKITCLGKPCLLLFSIQKKHAHKDSSVQVQARDQQDRTKDNKYCSSLPPLPKLSFQYALG